MSSRCGDCDCKPSSLDILDDDLPSKPESNGKSDQETVKSSPSNNSMDSQSGSSEKGMFQDRDCDESARRVAAMTFQQKVIHYSKSLLRMEPGFLIYMVASVMGNIMASDLLLDRACRVNVGYNDTICDVLTST